MIFDGPDVTPEAVSTVQMWEITAIVSSLIPLFALVFQLLIFAPCRKSFGDMRRWRSPLVQIICNSESIGKSNVLYGPISLDNNLLYMGMWTSVKGICLERFIILTVISVIWQARVPMLAKPSPVMVTELQSPSQGTQVPVMVGGSDTCWWQSPSIHPSSQIQVPPAR